MARLFGDKSSIVGRALLVGDSLDVLRIDTRDRIAGGPPVLPAGASGCAVLLRYGVVVTYDLSPAEEQTLLAQIAPFVRGPLPQPRLEEVRLAVDPKRPEAVEEGRVTVTDLGVETLQVVADILGKTVALDEYEQTVSAVFDEIEGLAAAMARKRRLARHDRELVRHIGHALLIQQRMVGRVEVNDKPDVLWDYPKLERLYKRLEDEFEIIERHLALERKLAIISNTAETVLGLLYNRRSLRVEWYIVALIVFEIALTLVEKL